MQPTIPDFGIDIHGLISAAVGNIGTIFGIAIGIYFGFIIIRVGIKYAGAAMLGRGLDAPPGETYDGLFDDLYEATDRGTYRYYSTDSSDYTKN